MPAQMYSFQEWTWLFSNSHLPSTPNVHLVYQLSVITDVTSNSLSSLRNIHDFCLQLFQTHPNLQLYPYPWLFPEKLGCFTPSQIAQQLLHFTLKLSILIFIVPQNVNSTMLFPSVTSLFLQLFLLSICSSETIKLWHLSRVFFKISFTNTHTHTPPCFNHLIKMDTSGTGSNFHKRAHFFSPGQPALMTAILLQPSHLLTQLKAQSSRFLKSLHNTVNFCCLFF